MASKDNAQAVGGDIECLLSDFQFQVQLPQLEVGAGYVADQGGDHTPSRFLAREILSASRFRQTPDPAPDVEFPSDRESCLGEAHIRVGAPREECNGSNL